VITLRDNPWPHLLVDDFLPDEVLRRAITDVQSETYEYEMESRGSGRIEFALLKSETLWRAIYSKRTIALLSAAFGVDVQLNKHNMVQLRRMNDLTPDFPLHSDFTSDGDTIASFLYISGDWSTKCGGYLHLFESGEQETPCISIEPIQNRFVAFRTKASHWHSVERVCGWERLSVLALWNICESQNA
jgi:2OG-Fe(II) oxygenase superfamily